MVRDEEEKFDLCDFFMIRSPLLTSNDYKNISNGLDMENQLKKMYNSPIIRESILVSSKSLYDSLNEMYSSGMHNSKVIESFTKYLIRMSTRTTPFGLFAGVDIGKYHECGKIIHKNIDEYTKYCRIDTGWLMKVIEKIEENNDFLIELKLRRNESYIEKGTKLENLYVSHYGQKDVKRRYCSVTIKKTNVIKYVLEKCKEPISVKEIVEEIQKMNSDININVILDLLKNLLKNEFLITELRPPLTELNPLEYVLNILKEEENLTNVYNDLNDINNEIVEYNKMSIGNGEEQFLLITDKMSKLLKCDNYLQVDLKLALEQATIKDEIGKRIQDFTNIVSKLYTIRSSTDYMKQYMNDFIEKYGVNREVDFLEVIDEEIGIGYPATYMHPMSERMLYSMNKTKNELKFENLIYKKVVDGLMSKTEEVIIKNEDINRLSLEEDNDKNSELFTSFELNFFISSNNIDNDDAEICLSHSIGANSIGKTLGRFLYMFDEDFNRSLKELKHKDNTIKNNSDSIPCELSYLCENGRALNVTLTKNIFDNELIINTNSISKNTITLKDLLIGVENNKFYLKSKKLNKRLNLYITHMLNPNICSNLYRLLAEISSQVDNFGFFKIYYEVLDRFIYVPRIKLGTIVVSPKTWKINEQILEFDTGKNCYEQFLLAFSNYRSMYMVPQYIFLTQSDNKLLLNLDNELHLKILYKQIKNSTVDTIMTECNMDIENLKDTSDKRYLYEIVTPFRRNNPSKVNSKHNNIMYIEEKHNIISKERIQLPFDKWIYFKLYGNCKREEEVISFELNKLICNLKEKNIITKAFFIRYKDPQRHIRVRMLKNDGHEKELMNELISFTETMYNQRLLSKIQYDTYEKELERYGGIKLISLAEEIFDSDSMYVINLLNQIKNNRIAFNKKIVGVISIIKFMEDFGLSFNEQLELFDHVINQKENREEFIKCRKDLIKLCNSNSEWINLRSEKSGQALYNLLQARSGSIIDYRNRFDEVEAKKELSSTKEEIILSFIHMYCNRFYGINRVLEREVMALTRHTLYSLKYFKNHKRKKE
ncbi:lantibiotic dehydratase [Clostridium paraputrificum]|uniref:lantibiotic dehydratase n=1 Tax=Clostridium paraputrificum TaxID=29363 RepID=UPI003D33F006